MSADWTTDRLNRLTVLWRDGISQSEIGAALGVTRNVIASKVRRIGLTPRLVPQWRPDAVKKKKPVEEPEPCNPIYLPDDTRDFTARFFDDPLPGRSALDRRREEERRL